MTTSVHYRRRHNNVTTTPTPIVRTQRWPVTRTNASRLTVLATLAAYVKGHQAYQWTRVVPQQDGQYVRWSY